MAKQLLNLGNGAVVVNEDAGVISVVVAEAASVGGGEAAGILKVQGSASVVLDGQSGVKLGEALLNSHLPTSVQPLAAVVEGIANQAIAALE